MDRIRLASVCKNWSSTSVPICETKTLDEVRVHDYLALHFSKDGWLVVFIMNLFTDDEIVESPPMIYVSYCFDDISFSSVPTSSGCVLFGISGSLTIESELEVLCNLRFHRSSSIAWAWKEILVFLTLKRRRGPFFANPKPSHPMKRKSKSSPQWAKRDCYLVESTKGELMSMFVQNDGEKAL